MLKTLYGRMIRLFINDIRCTEIIKILGNEGISPVQWTIGFLPDEVETVLSIIEEFILKEYGDIGKLVMVWDKYDDYGFGGSADLFITTNGNQSYAIHIPLIDGDFKTFFEEIESFVLAETDAVPTNFKNLHYMDYSYNAALFNQNY